MRPTSLAVLAIAFAAAGCADPRIEAVSRLGATADTAGPYVVEAVVVDALRGDRVELDYAVDSSDDGDFVPLLMERDSDGDRDGGGDGEHFRAGIPGQPAGSTVYYFVAVVRDGAVVVAEPDAAELSPLAFDIAP